MSLKTTMIRAAVALAAMVGINAGPAAQNALRSFELPDPSLAPRRGKTSGGNGGRKGPRDLADFGCRPVSRGRVSKYAGKPISAPPAGFHYAEGKDGRNGLPKLVQNKRRVPNKLELIERMDYNIEISSCSDTEPHGNMPSDDFFAKGMHVPVGHIKQARERAIEIRERKTYRDDSDLIAAGQARSARLAGAIG